MTRRARSLVASALLALLAVLPAVAPQGAVPAAAQQPGTGTPETARTTLIAIDTAVGPGAPGRDDGVGWTLLVENAGTTVWERLEVVAELHGALGSRSALRSALSGGAVPAVAQRLIVAAPAGMLAPGGVALVDGVVPLSGSGLTGPDGAVHPLRLRVVADGEVVGRLDTAVVRLGTTPAAPLATSLVWPLSAPPSRDPAGATYAALDPLTVDGGRLDTLVSALTTMLTTAAAAPSGNGSNGNGNGDAPASATATTSSDARSLLQGLTFVAPAHLIEDLVLRTAALPPSLSDAPPETPPGTPPEALEEGPLDLGPPLPGPSEAPDEAMVRAALLLQRIRTAVGALPVGPVVTPYADADIGRLVASGPALQTLAGRAMLEGARRLTPLLGRQPTSAVLLGAPVAPRALDLLPTSTVLLPYEAIEAPDLALDVPLGEPVRTLRSPTGRVFTALIADPYLTASLGVSTRAAPGDPVLAAHEVLIRTAMVHLEAPGRAGRGLLLLPPANFDPDPRFAAELLTRLASAPWLDPRPPMQVIVAQEVPEPARLAGVTDERLPTRLVTALTTTARDLELLAGAVDPTGSPLPPDPDGDGPLAAPIPVGARDLSTASDELMRATSTAFANDVDRAVALLDGVRAGVDASFGTVTVLASDVTLTDREGTVPITVVHAGGVPLRVRVEVTGPAALSWTDGRVRELTLGVDVERSLEVPVRSGATGRFPVTVRVTDPSGERTLSEDTIGVRATAVAGPALATIAAVVMALTVIGTVRQRRRGLAWRTSRPDELR
jgi:hypothetical protein